MAQSKGRVRTMFCEKCGRPIDEDDKVCPLCHEPIRINNDNSVQTETDSIVYSQINYITPPQTDESGANITAEDSIKYKSRITAGFLQVFLGVIGAGRFYMGYSGIGILQIAASLVTCGVGGFVWGFIDGLRILDGYPEKDAAGNVLK